MPAPSLRPSTVFAVLALLGSGCASDPGPAAPGAQGGAASSAPASGDGHASVELSAVAPATLAVIEAGAAPRSPLRLVAPAAGAERSLAVASTFTLTPRQDGSPLPPRQLHERREVAVVHEGTDDGGVSTYALRLTELSREGGPAPTDLVGRQARWSVDARGRLLQRGVQNDGLDAAAAAQLDQMVGGLAELFVPLPEEPMGIGGRWTVTETVDQPSGQETRTTTWMLVTRDDRGFVLTGETTGALEPAEAAQGLPSRRFFGESRVAFVAGLVLPDRVDSRGLSTRTAVLTRPDGKPGTLTTETQWTTTVSEVLPGD